MEKLDACDRELVRVYIESHHSLRQVIDSRISTSRRNSLKNLSWDQCDTTPMRDCWKSFIKLFLKDECLYFWELLDCSFFAESTKERPCGFKWIWFFSSYCESMDGLARYLPNVIWRLFIEDYDSHDTNVSLPVSLLWEFVYLNCMHWTARGSSPMEVHITHWRLLGLKKALITVLSP